jgi:hypothetical protein
MTKQVNQRYRDSEKGPLTLPQPATYQLPQKLILTLSLS